MDSQTISEIGWEYNRFNYALTISLVTYQDEKTTKLIIYLVVILDKLEFCTLHYSILIPFN